MNTLILNRRTLCTGSAALLLLAGCTTLPMNHIEGTATYRERMLLPPGSRLEVTVEDISLADVPATVLSRTVVQLSGAPPYPFTVQYRASGMAPGHRHGIRARIEHEGRLLFITDTHHALPRPDDAEPLQLMLVRAQPPSTATLENTYWKLLRLGDQAVQVEDNAREPHLILRVDEDGGRAVSGFAGCNGLAGSFTLEGEHIAFPQLASTLRACATGMDTEQAFHEALAAARRWAIRGEQLTLSDADGRQVALFESRYL